jgi:hypothetical protein
MKQTRSLIFISLIGVCLTNLAYAGAWTQSSGSGQVILTLDYYRATQLWDTRGNKQPQKHYSKYELSPYFEYGLRDDITIGANLSLERASQNSTNWGLGDSEVFLRKRIYNHNGFVASVEPMIKLPSPESSTAQPRIGSSNLDLAMGLSGGYGFSAYGNNHFVGVDSQYRRRLGKAKDQLKITASAGIGITKRWMLMPQSFLTYCTAKSTTASFTQSSADDYNQARLQLSVLYKLSDTTSLQTGGFADIDGKNAGVGKGLNMALWKRF